MLRIYGRRNSANVQKVMWLVGELELPHEHVPWGGSFGGLDEPEYRAIHPRGKVPAIDDEGTHVWESHAILRYLAARYAPKRFWSESAAARARIDPLIDWAQTSLQPNFLGGVFWGFYRTPEPQRDWPAIRASLSRCAQDLEFIDSIVSRQPYLAGDVLTLADIPVATLLYRYFTLDIERAALPHLEAYYARLQARPAYREHVMVPYDDLYGRLAF